MLGVPTVTHNAEVKQGFDETQPLRQRYQCKQVAGLVELKARFDEQNNVVWARELESSGVHVVYGLMGLKTHTKVVLAMRQEGDSIRRYVHIGTGNYNPKTAKVYTDLGLLSCREDLGADLTDLVSENIRVISIVGRYLEHSRIFHFYNNGQKEVFIGSADWMARNLDRRVEAVTPVEDADVAKELKEILDILLRDNRHSWELQSDGCYVQRSPGDDVERCGDILPTLMLTHTERASHRLLLSHRTLDEL